jgi:acyl-CoA reductase-like NAD-dependent aldehyde dehydrogenase
MADLVRMLALDVTNAVDAVLGNAEVTADEDLVDFDLDVARTVFAGSAIAEVRASASADALRDVADELEEESRELADWLRSRARIIQEPAGQALAFDIPGFDWLQAGLEALTIRPQGSGLDVDDSRPQA